MIFFELTCQTPTVALAMRIRRITSGSTNAVMRLSSSLCSSNKANTYLREKKTNCISMLSIALTYE